MNTGRGEKWVIGQMILLAAIMFAPLLGRSPSVLSILFGSALLIIGLIAGLLSIRALKSSLTVFPRPLESGQLVQAGIYGIVRHPIYTSVILVSLGWSIFWMSAIGLILSLVLAVYFDRKAHSEEQWLVEKYPEYAAYRQRVHKLIPWIY